LDLLDQQDLKDRPDLKDRLEPMDQQVLSVLSDLVDPRATQVAVEIQENHQTALYSSIIPDTWVPQPEALWF